jgi:deoxyribose-phosphate aldolase
MLCFSFAAKRVTGTGQPMPSENPSKLIVETAKVTSPSSLPADPGTAVAARGGKLLGANRGTSLNLDWIDQVRVNTSAAERRAATLVARRPLQQELVEKLGIDELNVKVGAVCVYHLFVETARRALEGSGIPVAAVSTGFPAGLSPLEERIAEIQKSVEAGAQEIDVVITRAHVFGGQWQKLYDEILAFKDACGPAHLKVILGTGDLLTLRNVAKASLVAMMAGADFIKTSTGKEAVNATLPVGLVMTRAIREYAEETGMAVGFKPAGGIRTAKQSIEWLMLMKEELGDAWLAPHLFRMGASGMLADIERQLEFHVTGRYSAEHRHPMA